MSSSITGLAAKIEERLAQINASMSVYRADSEISRFNRFKLNLAGAVEEAELGVEVEVDEVRLDAHSHSIVEGGLVLTS